MLIALTRPVSACLADCELTHLARAPIDVARAVAEHEAYEKLLESLGATVRRAAATPELPDAVFVEDAAIVLDEVAVITRPGVASRQAETATVAQALARFRTLVQLTAPATLDGGDVLRLGRALYVGRSSRTNAAGLAQLESAVAEWDYSVHPLEVSGCLHLKSAVTPVAEGVLVVNPEWVPRGAFPGYELVEIDPAEPYAANALRIGDTVIFPAHFPGTRKRLRSRGLCIAELECSELAKAEAGVTCCSIVFDAAGREVDV